VVVPASVADGADGADVADVAAAARPAPTASARQAKITAALNIRKDRRLMGTSLNPENSRKISIEGFRLDYASL
jgi:hypothetical protein